MNNQPYSSDENETAAPFLRADGPEFTSIDDPKLKWPPYVLAMLKLGRILTQKEHIKREVTAEQISRYFQKYQLARYRPAEIRELFDCNNCYLVGGGIQVEGYQLSKPYRSFPHYKFTFTRL
jgi:hypothetical protein